MKSCPSLDELLEGCLEHLNSCDECQKKVRDWKKLQDCFQQDLQSFTPSAAWRVKLRERLSYRDSDRTSIWIQGVALACSMLLFIWSQPSMEMIAQSYGGPELEQIFLLEEYFLGEVL